MVCLRCASASLLNVNYSDVSSCQEIYYERVLDTWVGRPSLQFYEEAIFAVPTFFTGKITSMRASVRHNA